MPGTYLGTYSYPGSTKVHYSIGWACQASCKPSFTAYSTKPGTASGIRYALPGAAGRRRGAGAARRRLLPPPTPRRLARHFTALALLGGLDGKRREHTNEIGEHRLGHSITQRDETTLAAHLVLRSQTSAMSQVRPVPPRPLRSWHSTRSLPLAVVAAGTCSDSFCIGAGGRK